VQPLLQWKSYKYYVFWVCVCSLRYQHAVCMCRIVTCGLSCSTIFSTLSHKGQKFRKKLLNMKCVFCVSLQLMFETFLILRRTERDTIKMYIGLHIKYPLFSSYFNEIFLDIFSKNTRNIKFYTNPSSRSRIVPRGRTAAQTDMTKLIVAFRNFANATKNGAFKIDAQQLPTRM
jgi:hypothetical protein